MSCTLNVLAESKGWSVDHLSTRWGLSETTAYRQNVIEIPYLGYDNAIECVRYRVNLTKGDKDNRFLWRSGDVVQPYGRWMLSNTCAEWSDVQHILVIVEGESDVWAVAAAGFPCLGLPGASATDCLTSDDVRGVTEIYVWQEPDRAGSGFPSNVKRRLLDIGYTGSCKAISAAGFKDPADIHLEKVKTGFDSDSEALGTNTVLWESIKAAVEVEVAEAKHTTSVHAVLLSCAKKPRQPNKKLTEKLSVWIAEHESTGSQPTYRAIMSWLVRAFSATVKHEQVSGVFLSHPWIAAWLNDHPNQLRTWADSVQEAYNHWATPKCCCGLEQPRSPLVYMSDYNPSDAFLEFLRGFEALNGVKLPETVYGEIEWLMTQPNSKMIYELICGGGKSTGSTAWILYRKKEQFLVVRERREDLYALRDMLKFNGESSVGLLVGYDDDVCTRTPEPTRFEVYDRQSSPCKSCDSPCDFKSSIDPAARAEQLSRRVVLITHKMLLSMLHKQQVDPDRTIIIDEGLKSIEDFELTADVETSLRTIFPAGGPGYQLLFDQIDFLRAKTRDGGAYVDDYNGEPYVERLTNLCYKKFRKFTRNGLTKMIPHIENCLAWLCFLRSGQTRAAMATKKGLRLRSAVRDMDVPNHVVVLDGSASISRAMWRDFTIYRSSITPPQYSNTTIRAFRYHPTIRQRDIQMVVVRDKFIEYVKRTKSKAWVCINNDVKKIEPILNDILAYTEVTITRGHIMSNNRARDCSQAILACSIFTDLSDYALSAALFSGKSIPSSEIFSKNESKGIVSPKMNQYGFENPDLQHEHVRQYTDELYQMLMRGLIRCDPTATYDAFCFLSSELIAANLLERMPGLTIVDAEGDNSFRLLDLYRKHQPETIQELMQLARLEVDDIAPIDICKTIFAVLGGK